MKLNEFKAERLFGRGQRGVDFHLGAFQCFVDARMAESADSEDRGEPV